MMTVAFKGPRGDAAFTWAPGQTHFHIVNIDDWIAGSLTGQWTGWYCYSDQPPSVPKPHSFAGHCKGIVLWNASRATWLVHSVPHWPHTTPLEPLPPSNAAMGHSFACWTGSADKLFKIEAQVDLMRAKVFLGTRSVLCTVPVIATLQRISLDSTVDHLAKNKEWQRDVYESLGACRARTRATLLPTSSVTNVPGWWNPKSDHSAWAVSASWVFVGDLHRTPEHLSRGGGGFVIYDKDLVQAVEGLLSDLEAQDSRRASILVGAPNASLGDLES